MNLLVTGGAGYVGSHTCKHLKKHGYTPVTLDNLSRGHEWAVKFGPFVRGDIHDQDLVKKIVSDFDIQGVFHFAAFAYVGESMEKPDMYVKNNVNGTLNLLEALKETPVRKFIFSSTCATYGIPEKLPITEETPQNPINPYGQTKLDMEGALKKYGEEHGFSCVALRYFNAAGADPELEIGEHHEPETHLIPRVLEATLTQNTKVTVMGTDYDTPDGTCVRDYIHVNDLASAHLLAFERLDAPGFEAFNLGTGQGSSVREIISAVEKVCNKKCPQVEGARREGDPPILLASARKANENLKWQPHHSMESCIETAAEWYKKYFKL